MAFVHQHPNRVHEEAPGGGRGMRKKKKSMVQVSHNPLSFSFLHRLLLSVLGAIS